MSEPLTREQVEQIFAQRMDEQAFSVLLATDAALREQLAQATQERDKAKQIAEIQMRETVKAALLIDQTFQQLATAQSRITQLEKALEYCAIEPWHLRPENNVQFLVAQQALAKEGP